MKKIIFLIGESGCGKTAIAEMLNELYGLTSINSYTTRPKRYKDERGHVFITDTEFNAINPADMIAYTEFDGYKYCATKKQLNNSDVYIIDVKGIETYLEKLKNSPNGDLKQPIIFYIHTDEETRRLRMEVRKDKNIPQRLLNDRIMFKNAAEVADYVIENNADTDIKTAAKQIWRYFSVS